MQKFILLLLFMFHQIGYSQSLFEPVFSDLEKLNTSGEELILETDRQLYCIDEKIYFTVGYKFNYPIDYIQWSNVIYVELIRWNGEKIAQAKYKLNEDGASGSLVIPSTIFSGNYYLRAYTRWMRNFPVKNYSYCKVKVINPFESEIDQGSAQEYDTNMQHSLPLRGNYYSGIFCSTDKSTYKQRERVELSIQFKNQDIDYTKFCVSVVKASSIDTNNYFIQIPDDASLDEQEKVYLPEYRGLSVSGKIVYEDTSAYSDSTILRLSIPQNWKYFSTYQENDNGLFYFTLPDLFGRYDFYIDAQLKNGGNAEILVDNDYCNRSLQLDYIPFSLDSAEKIIALEMAVNMQLSNMYDDDRTIDTVESKELSFFGKANHVYFAEEYIELPNLEEFIFELVNEIRRIKTDKGTSLKLVAYSQYQDLKPLILLDNIPVESVDELLKIPTEKIEQIEIFDEPHIISGTRYSGIICISSKRKDFAGIQLNKNSQFFAYNLLSEGTFKMTDYSFKDKNNETFRQNLLFWDPGLELYQDQINTISFFTSDAKGEYIIYVRSINERSNPQLYGTCKIVVE